MIKRVCTEKAPKAIGPYSQAVIAGGHLYVSGVIPIDPSTGEVVESTIIAQTEQIMKNIDEVIKEAGFREEDVVKTTCYLSDMSDFSDFNEVYGRYFVSKPARACIAVKALPKEVLAEVELIAYKEERGLSNG